MVHTLTVIPSTQHKPISQKNIHIQLIVKSIMYYSDQQNITV